MKKFMLLMVMISAMTIMTFTLAGCGSNATSETETMAQTEEVYDSEMLSAPVEEFGTNDEACYGVCAEAVEDCDYDYNCIEEPTNTPAVKTTSSNSACTKPDVVGNTDTATYSDTNTDMDTDTDAYANTCALTDMNLGLLSDDTRRETVFEAMQENMIGTWECRYDVLNVVCEILFAEDGTLSYTATNYDTDETESDLGTWRLVREGEIATLVINLGSRVENIETEWMLDSYYYDENVDLSNLHFLFDTKVSYKICDLYKISSPDEDCLQQETEYPES